MMGLLENKTLFLVGVLTVQCLSVSVEHVGSSGGKWSSDVTSPPTDYEETSDDDCLYLEAYHTPTNSCYTVGSRGPCNAYEVWYAKSEDLPEGDCYCIFSSVDLSTIGEVNRPLARSVLDNRCYALFSQANCGKIDEWFTIHPNKTDVGHCTPNICTNSSIGGMVEASASIRLDVLRVCDSYTRGHALENKLFEPFWFTHENECVKTFTLGNCGPPGGNHTLIFKGTDPTPICVDTDGPEFKMCLPGQSSGATEPVTRTGKCQDGDKKGTEECTYKTNVKINQD